MNLSDITSKKKIEDISKEKNIIKILKGVIISIVISILLLTIYAVILTYTSTSENTIKPVVITITGISLLIGSFISSMKLKKQGMLNGGIVGFIYILSIYIISSIWLSNFSIDLESIIMIIVSIITGMIGGIIGINIKWIIFNKIYLKQLIFLYF